MSTRILILKDGVITPSRSSSDNTAIVNSLGGSLVTSVNGSTGAITLTKSSVGLSLVDNTSDANKPVSTAQQTALNLKANLASPTFTGTVGGITSAMVGLGSLVNSLQLVASNNLSDLVSRQTALNNIVGAVTTGTYLRANGTNIVLSTIQASDIPTLNQSTTGTASNVTGIISISNGGTGSSTQNFVDLTTTQTIQGAKTFSGSPIVINAATTGTGGTGSVLKVVQTGGWSVNSPYVLEVIGYSYLDGFRISGQGGARGIYQIGSGLQLDFATNAGDITFTSGTTGTVERIRVYTSDGRVRIFSTTATTSTTTGALTVAGGAGFGGGICATLPTSSAGLTTGMMWRNGNVVNIV